MRGCNCHGLPMLLFFRNGSNGTTESYDINCDRCIDCSRGVLSFLYQDREISHDNPAVKPKIGLNWHRSMTPRRWTRRSGTLPGAEGIAISRKNSFQVLRGIVGDLLKMRSTKSFVIAKNGLEATVGGVEVHGCWLLDLGLPTKSKLPCAE